ncbi:unnamed protein product [Schistosoma mattheei]|uniref:Uncharacterized protein n=1 Tax=Schistosoma mattheei TaxID=31246 RepID=A0A183PY77_9TREM|nr:unnamed protein product [Schistosoma mattheei]
MTWSDFRRKYVWDYLKIEILNRVNSSHYCLTITGAGLYIKTWEYIVTN